MTQVSTAIAACWAASKRSGPTGCQSVVQYSWSRCTTGMSNARPRATAAVDLPEPARPMTAMRLGRATRSVVEDERHHHVDLVLGDVPVADVDPLLLDPGAADVAKRLGRPGDARLDGVLEALRRHGTDLSDSCDSHGVASSGCVGVPT